MRVLSRVGFPHTVLPHVKAQEIKAHAFLTGVQRVRYSCFTRDSDAAPCPLAMSPLFLLPFVALFYRSGE